MRVRARLLCTRVRTASAPGPLTRRTPFVVLLMKKRSLAKKRKRYLLGCIPRPGVGMYECLIALRKVRWRS